MCMEALSNGTFDSFSSRNTCGVFSLIGGESRRAEDWRSPFRRLWLARSPQFVSSLNTSTIASCQLQYCTLLSTEIEMRQWMLGLSRIILPCAVAKFDQHLFTAQREVNPCSAPEWHVLHSPDTTIGEFYGNLRNSAVMELKFRPPMTQLRNSTIFDVMPWNFEPPLFGPH
jgi:hypothetical protein